MRVGPMPMPVAAPEAIGFDDVTNGYVPWSRSSSVACAPSKSTSLPSRSAVVDEQRGVADERREPLREAGVLRPDLLEVEAAPTS